MRYLFVLLLAGCATTVPSDAGKRFTVEHYRSNFSGAKAAAQKHCASMGLTAQHLGTDRSTFGENLSRFECVAR